jgi:hypothetical protein
VVAAAGAGRSASPATSNKNATASPLRKERQSRDGITCYSPFIDRRSDSFTDPAQARLFLAGTGFDPSDQTRRGSIMGASRPHPETISLCHRAVKARRAKASIPIEKIIVENIREARHLPGFLAVGRNEIPAAPELIDGLDFRLRTTNHQHSHRCSTAWVTDC